MIELLLGTKRLEGFYPNSGPGPKKLLVGDPSYGVFGVTTDEELGGGSKLMISRLANESPSRKYHDYDNDSWLKMFINGNVYYYPYSPLAFGFTMQDAIMTRMYGDTGRPIAVGTAGATTVDANTLYSGPQDFRYATIDNGRRWVLAAHVMAVNPVNRPNNAWSTIPDGYEAAHIIGLAYGTSTNPIANSPLFTRMTRFTDEFGNYAMRVAGLTVYNGDKGELDPGYDIVSNAYSTHGASNEQGVYGVMQYQSAQDPVYFRPVIKLDASDAPVFEFFPIHSPRTEVNTPYLDQGIASIAASNAISGIVLEDAVVSDSVATTQGVSATVTSTAAITTLFMPSSTANHTHTLAVSQAMSGIDVVEQDELEKPLAGVIVGAASSAGVISEASVEALLSDGASEITNAFDSHTMPGAFLMTEHSSITTGGTHTAGLSADYKPASIYKSLAPILVNPTFKKA